MVTVRFDCIDSLVSLRRREFASASWVPRTRSWEMSPADAQRFLARAHAVALAPTYVLVGSDWHEVGKFRQRQASLPLRVDGVLRSQRLRAAIAAEMALVRA